MARREQQQGCWRAFPFVPLICLVILVVGIPLWVLHSYTAAARTSEALSAATVSPGTIQSVLGTLSLIRLAVLAVAIVAVVLVLLLAVSHAISRAGPGPRPPALRGFLAADALSSLVLWCLLVGAAVLLAVTASWMVCSIAAGMLLNTASQYSNTAEKLADRAVGSAQTLIEQLKSAQLSAMDTAPPEIKNSTWFTQFRQGVSTFNQTIVTAAGTPSSASCQPGCISLDFLAGLAGLDTSCICLTQTISSVQQGLQATKQATLQSLIGLLLVFLATSWLLMHAASTCTHTRRDLREHRRLAKSSSTGEGLFVGSTGRIPPNADALVDIPAEGKAAYVKAAGAGVSGAGQHHRSHYPVVQNLVVDTRGPRDASRLPRV